MSVTDILMCIFVWIINKMFPYSLNHDVQDESSLIWLSGRGERSLSLSSVSKIIPGQRTVGFVFISSCFLQLSSDHLLLFLLGGLNTTFMCF